MATQKKKSPFSPPFPPFPSPPPSPSYSGSTTPLQPPPKNITAKAPPPYQVPPPGWSPWGKAIPEVPKIDQDQLDYDAYRAEGGKLSKVEWLSAGKPSSDNQPSPGGQDDFSNPTKLPSTPPPTGFHWNWDGFRWQPERDKEDSKVDPELGNPKQMPSTPAPTGFHWEWDGKQWQPVKDKEGETRTKKSRQIGAPDKYTDAYGRIWTWDDYEGYQETGYDKTKDTRLTEKDKGIPQPSGEVPKDRFGRSATWDADDGEWRYPPDWDVDPKGEEKSAAERAAKEAEDRRRFEIEQRRATEEQTFRQQQAQQSSDQFWRQFDYQRQQDELRRQAEKEARLANLRASPASWLQYSLEANQVPVIQPWQKPLMPQQYGNLNVGQPIPGWQGLNQGSAKLPELATPSTQYFARIGPTAQQQWGGYQQMQSGAPIDESLFRLQSQSAPGGRNQGLNWLR